MSKRSPEYQRNWRQANKDKVKLHNRRAQLKRLYGLTLDEYEKLVLERENRCDICGRVVIGEGAKNTLHVDHDHKTGKRRGLICLQCNMLLGFAGDSLEILEAAISYLKFWNVSNP